MSQVIFDTINPATTSGNQLATILNDFKSAIVSGLSGVARPSELEAGGAWIDTTNNPTSWDYKIFDGVSDITVFTLNLTTGLASITNADSIFEIAKISADSVGPILRLLKSRIAANGQVLIGDTLGELQYKGTRDDGVEIIQARIKSIATNNAIATQAGAYLAFEVTTLDTASIAEVMRMIDGRVGIGTIAPENKLHVYGNGMMVEKASDDAVGSKLNIKKKRIAGLNQVLNNDVISEINSLSADDAGTEVAAAKIEVSARENHTSTAHGSKIVIKNKKIGQTAYTDQITIAEEVTVNTDLIITGGLTVQGVQTILNTATLDVEDANISVNKNGNQATANANKSGIKVEMTDATDAQLGYDSTKASKFVIGDEGSESEVATATHTQTLTNKTLTSPVINTATINNPTRAGVKEDTDANLVTYALTATNGQWCFATDSKIMYQVIDTLLVPVGAGGGGTTLRWNDSLNPPVLEYTDGFNLASFDNVSNQELYAVLTVPASYRAGKQIKLVAGQFFNLSTTGNVLFKTATALITSTSVLGTYPNIKTSTNTQVAVAGVANTANSIGVIDLTDASGLINGVSVLPGHKLRIRLYRDNTNETSGAANDSKLVVDSFEPTFS